MDRELEARLKKKIMANEELTEAEKKYFVNYDAWKAAHDQARKDTMDGIRWNAWPALFICAFFLLSTAFQNTKYLLAVGGNADVSVFVTTGVSWVLGIAAVVGSFYMKHRANEIARRISNASQLAISEEPEVPETGSKEAEE